MSVDAPADEALDAPLDADLGHGVPAPAPALHLAPLLLVVGRAQRVSGGRGGGGGVVARVHSPRDVLLLRRGPGTQQTNIRY